MRTACLAIAAATASAAAATGCGETESGRAEVAETVERYLVAFHRGQFERACRYVADPLERDLSRLVSSRQLGAPNYEARTGRVPCAGSHNLLTSFGAEDLILGGVDEDRIDRDGDVEIRNVEIDGEHARAQAAGTDRTIELERYDGEWKITRVELTRR